MVVDVGTCRKSVISRGMDSGGSVLGMLKDEQEGQCSWRRNSKRVVGGERGEWLGLRGERWPGAQSHGPLQVMVRTWLW